MGDNIMTANRNGFIELIRIILAYMIAAMHFNGSASGAYLGLEFFFMISGFYQMQKMEAGDFSPFPYTVNRFLKLIFVYETSILMLAFFGESGIDPMLFLRRMFISLPDMLCLQMVGIAHVSINPELWYVSSMLTAGFVLALLHKLFQGKFRYLLPIITIFCYSMLYKHYGTLEINHLVRDFSVPSGTIRGLAGMSLGCLLYYADAFIKAIDASRCKTSVLSLLFVFTSIISALCFFFKAHSSYDFFILFCAPAILLCAFSGETVFNNFFDRTGNTINALLGKQFSFGLVCYTAFSIVSSALLIPYHKLSSGAALAVFLLYLSIISFAGAKLADSFNKKYINKLVSAIDKLSISKHQ